jgi:hypothetical protein
MEFFNHFFGICGEYHPNIFTITLFVFSGILIFRNYKFKKSN